MASEADIPESVVTQKREEDMDRVSSECHKTKDVHPMKEDEQGKKNLAEAEGNNGNTDGGSFLYPPSVGKVASEDMEKLSEKHRESGTTDQTEITIPESNNQQQDNKAETTEDTKERATEILRLDAESNGVTKEVIFIDQEAASGAHIGEAARDIEQDKRGNSEMDADISDHNELLEVQTDEPSERKVCEEEKCTKRTLPTDPMELQVKFEAVGRPEDNAESEDKNVKDNGDTGITPPESIDLIEEKRCLQDVGRDNKLEDGSNYLYQENCQDPTEPSEKLKNEITAEDKSVESNIVTREEVMDSDKVGHNEAQTLLSKTDSEAMVNGVLYKDEPLNERPTEDAEETQEENPNKLVSVNEENVHQVAQGLALEQASAEKVRGDGGRNVDNSELISTQECMKNVAVKQEETEEKIEAVEATEETAFANEGDTKVVDANSDNQGKENDKLETDDFDTTVIPEHNTTKADVKETTRCEDSDASQNKNDSQAVEHSLEKEDEKQDAISISAPEEQEKLENEAPEKNIQNQEESEERKSREFTVLEGNSDEEASAQSLNSTTSKTEEGENSEFQESELKPERRQEINNAEELMESEASQSELQENRKSNEEEKETKGEDTPAAVHTSPQTGPETIMESHPVSILEVKESSISSEDKKHSEENGDDSRNLATENGKNEYTLSDYEHTHDNMENAMQENFQDKTEVRNLQPGTDQEVTDEGQLTDMMSKSTVDEVEERIKEETEEKSTEKIEEPEKATPRERTEIQTENVSQSQGEVIDSSIEKCEDSFEEDNQILSSKESVVEENQEERIPQLAAEEISDTSPPLQPEQNSILKFLQIDEQIEQAPLTSNTEAQGLNMVNEASDEAVSTRNPLEDSYPHKEEVEQNTREISADTIVNMEEPAVGLTYQGNKGEQHCFDEAEASISQTISEENNNVAPNVTKGEITDASNKEGNIPENSKEELAHSHQFIEESTEKVEAELHEAKDIEDEHIFEEDSACGDHLTGPANEETTKNSSPVEKTVTEMEGDDMELSTSLTEAEGKERSLEKKDDHVENSSESSVLPEDSAQQDTIAETKTTPTDQDITPSPALQEGLNEKVNDLNDKENGCSFEEEDTISREMPSDIILEESSEASSALPTPELDLLVPEGNKTMNETTFTENSKELSQFEPEDQSKKSNNVSESNNGEGQVCEPSMTDGPDKVKDNDIINEGSGEGKSSLRDQNQETSTDIEVNGSNVDAKDTIQIAERNVEALVGENNNQENEGPNNITDTVSAEEATKELELDEGTQSIEKEAIEGDVLHVTAEKADGEMGIDEDVHHSMGQKENAEEKLEKVNADPPQQHGESNTTESDNIEVSENGREHENSCSNDIHATDPVQDEEIVNHTCEEDSFGNEKGDQEIIEASQDRDQSTNIYNEEIQTVEVEQETALEKQLQNIEDADLHNKNDDVSATEILDPTGDAEKLECCSESINLIEANKAEIEATSTDVSDSGAESSENLIQNEYGDAKTLSNKEREIDLDMCSIDKAEDANESAEELQINEESQGKERVSKEEDFQQVITGEKTDYEVKSTDAKVNPPELENQRDMFMSDNIQVEEDGKTHELDKSCEMDDFVEEKEVVDQVLEADNSSIEKPDQQTSRGFEASGPNVGDDIVILSQDESSEMFDDKTQAEVDKAGVHAECQPQEHEGPERINSVSAEEVQYEDISITDNTTEIANVEVKDDVPKEPSTLTVAKTSEQCAQLEDSQCSEDVQAPESDIQKEGTEEEEKQEIDSGETTDMNGNLNAELEDDLSEEPGALVGARTSEECAALAELQSSGDVLAPDIDISKEDVNEEKQGVDFSEEANRKEAVNSEDASTSAKTSQECVSLEESQSSQDILATKSDFPVEGIKEEGVDCGETADTMETVNSEDKDNLSKPGEAITAKTSDECAPLDKSQPSEDVLAPEFNIPKEDVEEQEQGVHCSEAANKKEATNAEVEYDLSEEPDASIAEKTPEECVSLEVSQSSGNVVVPRFIPEESTKEEGVDCGETENKMESVISVNKDDLSEEPETSGECAQLGKSQPSEDAPVPQYDIPEGVKEQEQGEDCDQTASKMETVNELKTDISEEPEALSTTNTSEEHAPLKESQSSKDVIAPEFDIPRDGINEEKQGADAGETANMKETVTAEIKSDLSVEAGAAIAVKTAEECPPSEVNQSSKDVLSPEVDIPKEGIEEGEKQVCETENKIETADANTKDDLSELGASVEAKMSEECSPLEESQFTEDFLVPKFDISKEGNTEEGQGVECGLEDSETEIVNAEVRDDILQEPGETTNKNEMVMEEAKNDLSEEPGASITVKTAATCAPLEVSQSSEDVLTPELDCGESAHKTEIVNVDTKDDLSEELAEPLAEKMSKEFSPLEESQFTEDARVREFDIAEGIKEEEPGVESGVTDIKPETVNVEVKDDLLQEPGETANKKETVTTEVTSDVSEEPDASIAVNTAEECAPLEVTRPSTDVLTPELDYGETANKTETVNSNTNDLSEELGAPAEKMSKECSPLEESQFTEDVLIREFDISQEGIKEEERSLECGVTDTKIETVNEEEKDDLHQDPGAQVATKSFEESTPLEGSQSFEDDLPRVLDIPNEGIKMEEQKVNCGETTNQMETVNAEIKDDSIEEPSVGAQTSEERASLEESQSSEDVSDPEFDIQKEDMEEEAMEGVDNGENKLNTAILKEEMTSQEAHLQGNTVKAPDVSSSEDNEQADQVKQEAASTKTDTGESELTAPAMKEEKPDNSYSKNTAQEILLAEETRRELEVSDFEPSIVLQLEQELVEKAKIADESLTAEPRDLSSEFQGANDLSENEEKRESERYIDNCSQEITHENELQISNKSASTASLQNDSTSDNQEETESSELVSGLHGQGLTESDETEEKKHHNVKNSELIAEENQSEKNFEEQETTREEVNPMDPEADAPELPNEGNASEPAKVEVEQDEKAHEVTGSNEIDGSEPQNNEEAVNQGSEESNSGIEEPIQQKYTVPEAFGLHIDAEIQSQDESAEISTDRIQVVEVTKMETIETENHLNNVSTEKVQCMDKPYSEIKIEKMNAEVTDSLQGELNGSNVAKTPDEWDPLKDSERLEGVTTQEVAFPTETIEEEQQKVVACNDNMLNNKNVTLLKEETSLQEPYLQANIAEVLNISSIAEAEQTNNGKSCPLKVEELENLAAKDAEETRSPQLQHEPGYVAPRESDANLSTRELKVDALNVTEITAADIIANQIALAIEAEEKLQQQSYEQLEDKHETTITVVVNSILDIQVPNLKQNEEELIRKSCLPEDRERELEVLTLPYEPMNDGKPNQELAEKVRTTDKSSVECESQCQGANPPSEIETTRKPDSCTDSLKAILHENEAKELNKSGETTNITPQIDAISHPIPEENFGFASKLSKQIECCERAPELHDEGLTKSEETDPQQHHNEISSELIAEHESALTIQAHEATICGAAEEEVAEQRDVQDVSQGSLGEETKAQGDNEDKQASGGNPEEEEKKTILGRENEIPDEKVLCHDPDVVTAELSNETENGVTVDEETSDKSAVLAVSSQTDEEATGKGIHIIAENPKTDTSTSVLNTPETTEPREANSLTDDSGNPTEPEILEHASNITDSSILDKCARNTNANETEDGVTVDEQDTSEKSTVPAVSGQVDEEATGKESYIFAETPKTDTSTSVLDTPEKSESSPDSSLTDDSGNPTEPEILEHASNVTDGSIPHQCARNANANETENGVTVDEQETSDKSTVPAVSDHADEEATGKENYIIAEAPKTDSSTTVLNTPEKTEPRQANSLTDDSGNPTELEILEHASNVTNGSILHKCATNANGVRIEDDKEKDSLELRKMEDETKLNNTAIQSTLVAKKEGEQIILKEKTLDKEDARAGEPKTDLEKEEEGNGENQADSDLMIPISAGAMRDMDLKATNKKTHNILSGVGSKVKNSISKVFACSSPQFTEEDVIIKLNKNKKN